MIDLQEIEDEIKKLEHSETTYGNCEKLSILYTVRHYLAGDDVQPVDVGNGYSFATAPSSDFMQAVSIAPIEKVLRVLDDHMESIRALYPKEYDAVIRMIRE